MFHFQLRRRSLGFDAIYPMDILVYLPEQEAGGDCKGSKMGQQPGLRLARQVPEDAHISVGDHVEVTTKDGAIVIAPLKFIRGRARLRELVSHIPRHYKPEEADWGKIVGKEGW